MKLLHEFTKHPRAKKRTPQGPLNVVSGTTRRHSPRRQDTPFFRHGPEKRSTESACADLFLFFGPSGGAARYSGVDPPRMQPPRVQQKAPISTMTAIRAGSRCALGPALVANPAAGLVAGVVGRGSTLASVCGGCGVWRRSPPFATAGAQRRAGCRGSTVAPSRWHWSRAATTRASRRCRARQEGDAAGVVFPDVARAGDFVPAGQCGSNNSIDTSQAIPLA